MDLINVCDKVSKVIKSCVTLDQLVVAKKYNDLLIDREVRTKSYKEIKKILDIYERLLAIPLK